MKHILLDQAETLYVGCITKWIYNFTNQWKKLWLTGEQIRANELKCPLKFSNENLNPKKPVHRKPGQKRKVGSALEKDWIFVCVYLCKVLYIIMCFSYQCFNKIFMWTCVWALLRNQPTIRLNTNTNQSYGSEAHANQKFSCW